MTSSRCGGSLFIATLLSPRGFTVNGDCSAHCWISLKVGKHSIEVPCRSLPRLLFLLAFRQGSLKKLVDFSGNPDVWLSTAPFRVQRAKQGDREFASLSRCYDIWSISLFLANGLERRKDGRRMRKTSECNVKTEALERISY